MSLPSSTYYTISQSVMYEPASQEATSLVLCTVQHHLRQPISMTTTTLTLECQVSTPQSYMIHTIVSVVCKQPPSVITAYHTSKTPPGRQLASRRGGHYTRCSSTTTPTGVYIRCRKPKCFTRCGKYYMPTPISSLSNAY